MIRQPSKLLLGILAVYLFLASWNAVTRGPRGDEVQFANPALDLITRGKTGVTILSGFGVHPEGAAIDSHYKTYSYSVMPLSFVSLAAWFKIVGFGFFQMRAWAVLMGLLGLVSWYCVVRALTDSSAAALVAAGLISVDHAFLDAAADGRPDMQSAALGCASIAAYLLLRKRSLNSAVLISQISMALSVFTHPIAGVAMFGLLIIAVHLDRQRFEWRHVLLAAIPYAVAASLWAWYISLDPYAFRLQFFGNAAGRGGGLAKPFAAFLREIRLRYLENMYLPHYLHGFRRIQVLIPAIYAAGVMLPLLMPGFRRNRRNWLLLPILAVVYHIVFSLAEGTKSYYYLVHITPLFAVCCALCVCYWWEVKRPVGIAVGTGMVVLLVGLQVSWVVSACLRNSYRTSYLPVANFIEQHGSRDAVIIGQGEFAFVFGFYGNLTDDATLGYYTHIRPQWIIVDERVYRQSFAGFESTTPSIWKHVNTLLTEDYQKVFSVPNYDVYQQRVGT